MELSTIWQVGQSVMVCQVCHPGFRRAAVSDLVERGEPALFHRLEGHAERPATADLPVEGRQFAARDQLGAPLAHALHVLGRDQPMLDDAVGQLAICHARRQDAVRHAEHATETPIDDQQPAISIEHHQALQHVVERGVKALLLCVQSLSGPLAFFGHRKSGFRLGTCNLCRLQLFIPTQVTHGEQDRRADHQLQKSGRSDQQPSLISPVNKNQIHRVGDLDDHRRVFHREWCRSAVLCHQTG